MVDKIINAERGLSDTELREILVRMYKSFYMRPGYMMKSLMRIRSLSEFKRKAHAGLSVFTMTPNQKLYDKANQVVPDASYNTNAG